MTILVVEDERKTADTIQSYLEHAGYGVAVCSDGAEALNEAASGRCDLVVIDLALPTVDGIEICRALRESGRRVPIVMLTARTTEDDRVHGFDVGADDYVTKPFSPRELVRRVGAVLAVRDRQPIQCCAMASWSSISRTNRVNGTPTRVRIMSRGGDRHPATGHAKTRYDSGARPWLTLRVTR